MNRKRVEGRNVFMVGLISRYTPCPRLFVSLVMQNNRFSGLSTRVDAG